MRCEQCGTNEIEEAKFCGTCGSRLAINPTNSPEPIAQENNWPIRDLVYSWLIDAAREILGSFDLEESRNEQSRESTFAVNLKSVPPQYSEQVASIEGGAPGQNIRRDPFGDGRSLKIFVDVSESGSVIFFAYPDIRIPIVAYERACVAAIENSPRAKFANIELLKREDSVIVRICAATLINSAEVSEVLNTFVDHCLGLAYLSWEVFEQLSAKSAEQDGYNQTTDDEQKSGPMEVSKFVFLNDKKNPFYILYKTNLLPTPELFEHLEKIGVSNWKKMLNDANGSSDLQLQPTFVTGIGHCGNGVFDYVNAMIFGESTYFVGREFKVGDLGIDLSSCAGCYQGEKIFEQDHLRLNLDTLNLTRITHLQRELNDEFVMDGKSDHKSIRAKQGLKKFLGVFDNPGGNVFTFKWEDLNDLSHLSKDWPLGLRFN